MTEFLIVLLLGIIIVVIGALRFSNQKPLIRRVLCTLLALVMFVSIAFLGFFLFWMYMDRDRAITLLEHNEYHYNENGQYPHENIAPDEQALVTVYPVTLPTYINGEAVDMFGYKTSNGVVLFRLQEYERVFHGTQAQFYYRRTEMSDHINYSIFKFGAPRSHAGISAPDYGLNRISSNATRTQVNMLVHHLCRDARGDFVYAYEIDGYNYFPLDILAATLGITYYDVQSINGIRINTFEADISEYGHQVAVQFLSQFPTLFYSEWSEETLASIPYIRPWDNFPMPDEPELYSRFYPSLFMMYDFNGNGIPDFLIIYRTISTIDWFLRPTMHLFSYVNGSYEEITTIETWGGIFTAIDWSTLTTTGNIFTVEGSHQEGFTHVQKISFAGDIPVVTLVVEPREGNWERYFRDWNPLLPHIPRDPNTRLIAMRHIVNESISQEVIELLYASGRIPTHSTM